MEIRDIVWLDYVEDKLWWKHNVQRDEVKEVLRSRPKFTRKQRGDVHGEDMYNALGTTESGRHLSVFFIHKLTNDALILSARDMDKKERRRYGKK
ncbi:MAG: BrnT family toxin [Bacteroidota bacterium]